MNTATIILLIVVTGGFFVGTLPYIIETLRGTTNPNRITWLLWSIPMLPVFAQWMDGSLTWASYPVFMAGFGPLLIVMASFVNPKAYWKLEKFDYICGFIALVAFVIYFITQDVIIAIIISLIADTIAALPTLKKAYYHPDTETVWPFFMGFVDNILALFVMERYDFIEMAFPIYLICICFIFLYLLRNNMREDLQVIYKNYSRYIPYRK